MQSYVINSLFVVAVWINHDSTQNMWTNETKTIQKFKAILKYFLRKSNNKFVWNGLNWTKKKKNT